MNFITLRVKRRLVNLIRSGRKRLDVRVGYRHIREARPNSMALIGGKFDEVAVQIFAIRRYVSFEQMLDREDPDLIDPGTTRDRLLQNLRQIYPPDREALGVYVFEIAPVN